MAAAQATSRYPRSANQPYLMHERLALEETQKGWVDLLFMPHAVNDISSSVKERKSGTDFLLSPLASDGSHGAAIRCENKFEQYATGRQLLEFVSVDRGNMTPGWMFTSTTAWLLSWYPTSELVALPMDEARKLVLKNPSRHQTTTAKNPRYLSWSALEDINYMVANVENARVLDLSYELGKPSVGGKGPMLRGAALDKRCTVEELVALMATLPTESTPVPVSKEELIEIMRGMAPKNYKRLDHADMLKALPWL
jgi:hypothetical protein